MAERTQQGAPTTTPGDKIMYTQEEYNDKRAARLERLQAAAAQSYAQAETAGAQARAISDLIPFGQPILLGHHSEKRHRRDLARIENKMRRGYELYKKAEHYSDRAANMESNSDIYSDNPEAPDLLRIKIEHLQNYQDQMKRVNKAIKAGTDPAAIDMTEELRKKFNYYGGSFPSYALTNNNAKLRSAKERLTRVEKAQSAPDEEYQAGPIKIISCPSENRIRIFYPGKPDADTRTALKHHGYRWTPSLNCWQSFHTHNGMTHAQSIIKAHKETTADPIQAEADAPAPTPEPIDTKRATIAEIAAADPRIIIATINPRAKNDTQPATFKPAPAETPAAVQMALDLFTELTAE